MTDKDSLEDALDGLMDAVEYAESIDEHKLSRKISSLYQELGRVSPDEHWDPVYRYRAQGNDLYNVIKETEGSMVLADEDYYESLEFYATEEAAKLVEESESVSDLTRVSR